MIAPPRVKGPRPWIRNVLPLFEASRNVSFILTRRTIRVAAVEGIGAIIVLMSLTMKGRRFYPPIGGEGSSLNASV